MFKLSEEFDFSVETRLSEIALNGMFCALLMEQDLVS